MTLFTPLISPLMMPMTALTPVATPDLMLPQIVRAAEDAVPYLRDLERDRFPDPGDGVSHPAAAVDTADLMYSQTPVIRAQNQSQVTAITF